MQKIKPLLDQASKEFKKNSGRSLTEAGPTSASERSVAEPEADYEEDARLDHVDAINQLFAEFEFAYHNQFHKAFPDAESLAIAKKYWLSCLEQFPPPQIVQAGRAVVRRQPYLPSIAAMLQACEQGYELFGLPAPRQAYIEACSAPSPKHGFQWSHPAVYHAGRASGWYFLANEAEAKALPVFQYHYDLLCRQVARGEDLSVESPPPLPQQVERPLGAQETRRRLQQLRQELHLPSAGEED